jgi:LysM repeat protein
VFCVLLLGLGSIFSCIATEALAGEVYRVRRGDTLGKIARGNSVSIASLKLWNGLQSDRVYVDQFLKLSDPKADAAKTQYKVKKGDTLYSIARRMNVGVEELRKHNTLKKDRIYPGQTLTLRVAKIAPKPSSTHVVKRGDTLGAIATRYGMSLGALRAQNSLRSTRIYPGQRLSVASVSHESFLSLGDIDWALLQPTPSGVKFIDGASGPYYHTRPTAETQKGKSYVEGTKLRPLSAYRRARALFSDFEKRVEAMGTLSHALDGWHVVLDPGHGGIDPGAIVKTVDGNGDPLYVVEDEYVYDTVLRMYTLLKMHGAEVSLTLLSPNHLIRRNLPAARTFVHERNEVFFHLGINEKNRASSWPRGGPAGLKARRKVIAESVRSKRADRTIFVSIHADNSPNRGREPIVLYHERRGRRDMASKRFADTLLKSLGAGATSRGRSLAVLRDNPSEASVLVELRNLAYAENSWALRFTQERQLDAERVVNGILDYAGLNARVARAR